MAGIYTGVSRMRGRARAGGTHCVEGQALLGEVKTEETRHDGDDERFVVLKKLMFMKGDDN